MFSTNKAANATRLNPLNQEGRLLESDIRSAIDVLGFLRTGATLTEEQAKTYRNLFPTYLDTAATAKVKLDRLREEFNRAGATVQNASQGQTSFDINSLRNKYGY
jgi:hypothetical protein